MEEVCTRKSGILEICHHRLPANNEKILSSMLLEQRQANEEEDGDEGI
jgi:hypothetical protein